VKDEKTIFVVPNEVKLGSDTKWLMEKRIFSKEELFGMINLVDQQMRRKREVGPDMQSNRENN
jgi:hypothetical protein